MTASVSGTGVRLTWSPSTDNVGVAGYTVNRGSAAIGSTALTTYTDTTAPIGQRVSYTVTAFDSAGNRSGASATVSATMTADLVAPTAPSGLTAVAGTRQVTLGWTAASDNVGVSQYYVFRDTHKLALLGNVTGYTDTALVTGTRTSTRSTRSTPRATGADPLPRWPPPHAEARVWAALVPSGAPSPMGHM